MRIASHLTFGLVVAMFWIWFAGTTDGVVMDTIVVLGSMHLGGTLVYQWSAKSK
jgi:hypothetical protein